MITGGGDNSFGEGKGKEKESGVLENQRAHLIHQSQKGQAIQGRAAKGLIHREKRKQIDLLRKV